MIEAATPTLVNGKPYADHEAAEMPKRLGLTVGRLRAIDAKVEQGWVDLAKAEQLVGELMAGREGRASEKVDALRAIGSRITQIEGPLGELRGAIHDLIELVLDDD